MAAPSKYTKATLKVIEQALSAGCYHKLAAHAAGISETTWCEWINTKPGFAELVEKAEAKASQRWLALIERAAEDGNWQAAAWKLERRYPDFYGQPKVRHEVTGPNGGNIPVEFIARTAIAEVAAGSIADSRSAE
jgi:hypothetical protein